MRLKPTRQHYEQVVQLRRQGMTIREISAKTGVAKSAVHRWLSIFAGENLPAMKKTTTSPKRVTGIRVPQSKEKTSAIPVSSIEETAEEKIARLEKELEDARLRADLYEEIINVAEKKFDIQIRKKAGTKQ
ncbi:MAG: helix-turn-helix domain-containing protein [Bacteroidales bacterium]|nr:helix-turn-helix domain-containing protein [Bacteroidales bacterium]